MSSRKQVRKKYYRQLEYAAWKRRELVEQLYEMIDDLEGRPLRRSPYSYFPFNILERGIHVGLDKIENNFVKKLWTRTRKQKVR